MTSESARLEDLLSFAIQEGQVCFVDRQVHPAGLAGRQIQPGVSLEFFSGPRHGARQSRT